MPRPSYDIAIPTKFISETVINGVTYKDVYNGTSGSASETVAGTKRLKPKGWIPPTPYTLTHHVFRSGYGKSFTIRGNKTTTHTWFGALGGSGVASIGGPYSFSSKVSSLPADWQLDYLNDRALTKARIKMKQSKVNLGVAFAERKQTARLVADTALQLVKSVRALRKGNFNDAAKALGINRPGKPRGSSVTSRWLELQYGWKPLLGDVYGATEALAARDRHDWMVTAKATEEVNADRQYFITDSSGYLEVIPVSELKRYGYFVRIDAIPGNSLLGAFASAGITNPLLVGWELVPFSFVADWFLPVGDFLESMDAMIGYSDSWSSSTLRIRREARSFPSVTFSNTDNTYGGKYTTSYMCSSDFRKDVRIVRTATRGVPLPTMPRFKDPVSLGRMANALSLLSQVFQGRK